MIGTINKIKSISSMLIGLIEDSQKLAKVYYKLDDLGGLDELKEIVDEMESKKDKEIRDLVEDLLNESKLYLALTTPYSVDEEDGEDNPFSVLDEDKEELGRELEALYEQYKELTSIGPDPEQGYDRSYESEKSRIEDAIDHLEMEILEPSE